MKRLKGLAVALIAGVLAVGAFALAACGETEGSALTGSMTVVVCDQLDEDSETLVYPVDLSNFTTKDSAEAVINWLVDNDNLYYEGYRSSTGMYFTTVGYRYTPEGSEYESTKYVVAQDYSSGKYVFIYTSVEQDQDTSGYATSVTYEGQTLVSAGVGISFMHIGDGAVIYIGTVSWA